MVQLAKEQRYLTVSDKLYGELIGRWMIVEITEKRHLFIKHFTVLNPHRNRYMLMQLVLSDFKQGRCFEAVYEGHARLTRWVEQVEIDGIPYPKLSVNNGCFDVLQWQVFGEMSYVTAIDLGREKFFDFLVHEKFVSPEELRDVVDKGVNAQSEWLKAVL